MSSLNIVIRPEFFRLPHKGVDPYFGLSRSFYYDLDASGQVLLVRLRKRGSQRGVTLVNYEAMSTFLSKRNVGLDEAQQTPEPESAPAFHTSATDNVHRIVQSYSKETELMRKIAPSLLHDVLKTITDLEQMLHAASRQLR